MCVFLPGPEDLVANSVELFREVVLSCIWYACLDSD